MRFVYLSRLIPLTFFFFFSTANSQLIFTKAGSGNPGDYKLATEAYLLSPKAIAFDASGNMYTADNNCIRKVDAVTGSITTVAGNGVYGFSGDGGLATTASFKAPSGIALDKNGNLYIADDGNYRLRKVSAATGIVTTVAGNGNPTYSVEGVQATMATLHPYRLLLDPNENIYVADTENERIWKIDAVTGIITTLAGNGTQGFSGDGGSAKTASLSLPVGLAMDASDNLYIADAFNGRIRKVNASTGIITTVAGANLGGFWGDGGPATSAWLNWPFGVAVDSSGNIFIADKHNYRIRKVDASGIITTIAGNGSQNYTGDGGPAYLASFASLEALALDTKGNIFLTDNSSIRKITKATGKIDLVAGNRTGSGLGDNGPATAAWFYSPGGMAADKYGNLYIADRNIRKVDAATGVITTVAGNGTIGFSGDGGPATAASLSSGSVALDANGNMYIADPSNNRVRKVDGVTGIITTVAGNGIEGFSGDNGQAIAASLDSPSSIALDQNGNLYISDYYNRRVRKVSAINGIITTVAGNGISGFSGDGGPATAASFYSLLGMTIDANGNLYIADGSNFRVRKVDAVTGIVTTFAGTGVYGFSGDGGPATSAALSLPQAVATDIAGNIYITDAYNQRLRKVDIVTGIITTVAGSENSGNSGDGGQATAASLSFPKGVVVDANGNIYISDQGNHNIRYVCASSSLSSSTKYDTRTLYPDQNPSVFSSNCTVQAKLQPSGANPVTGTIADSVWIEPTVPIYNGQPYVQRHYGITPSQNASTATATITLYYTQAEFTAYNAVPNHGPDLPVDAADAMGHKANIRIQKRPGTSNNGTGLFDTYSGNTVGIVPTSVVWDNNLNAWAVTFNVTGFSGFFLNTAAIVLPVQLTSLNAKLSGNDGVVTWQTESEEATVAFEVERSTNGSSFTRVGTVAAAGRSSLPQHYDYTDKAIAALGVPVVYYRLKTVDSDGRFAYSKTVAVNISSRSAIVTLYPNPVSTTATLQIAARKNETLRVSIVDAGGRTVVVKSITATPGSNAVTLDTQALSSGSYTLLLRGPETTAQLKLVKQ